MRFPLLAVLLSMYLIPARSADFSGDEKCRRSTEGKEFWFGYMQGRNSSNHYVELTVTAREAATFSIYVGKSTTPVVANQTLGSNQWFQFQWPTYNMVEPTVSESVLPLGIHLVSDNPVNVYTLNHDNNSSDVAVMYPVESLGSEYFTMCYKPHIQNQQTNLQGRNSEFVIVASDDSTNVTIIPSTYTDQLKPGGIPFNVKLNKGELYQVQSYNTVNDSRQGDLTGSYIKSDKPVAVYSGSLSATIPVEATGGWDHLYEQMPPVITWGREYYTIPLANRSRDFFRILASKDNTKIYIGNNAPITLNRGMYYEYFSSTATRIYSDKPILVSQYSQSRNNDNAANGDGFMVMLSPVSQAKNDVTFIAYQSTLMRTYYVNIVVPITETGNIELAGNIITSSSFTPYSNGKFAWVSVPISPGAWRLRTLNPAKGFIAYVYAFGGNEAYGYGVGFNLNPVLDLSEGMITFDTAGDTLSICQGDSIRLDAGTHFDRFKWNTGDTTQQIMARIQKKYSVTATISGLGCLQSDSIFVHVSNPKTSLGPDLSGCSPFSATLNAGAGFTRYEWNTGDTSQKLKVDSTGLYHIAAYDRYDCPARDTMRFTAFPLPVIKLETNTLVCDNKKSSVQVSITGVDDQVWLKGSATWGSNNPGKLVFKKQGINTADFEVSDYGRYLIRYQLTTADGCRVSDSIWIGLYQKPTSSFNRIDNSADKCKDYNWEFKYDGNATQNARFYWDYGGCKLIDKLSWDRFTVSVGAFNSNPFITLYVEENGCISDTTKKAIGANPDFRITTKKSRGCDSTTIYFRGELKVPDALVFEWDFGDGSPLSNEQEPTHFYNKTGYYDVRLNITNKFTGCQVGYKIDDMVKVFPTPVAKISADPSVCNSDTIRVFYTMNVDSSLCYWEFTGAGQIGTGNDSIKVLIKDPTAQIRLRVDEFGCLSKQVQTTVKRKPHFNFATDTTQGCQPFKALVRAIPYDKNIEFTWLTDSLVRPKGNQLEYLLPDSGRVSITLAAHSTETGCSDTLSKSKWIWVHPKPTAAFEVDYPVATIENALITFTNQSQLSTLYKWDFGDNATSPEKSPKHKYAAVGEYPVVLQVESKYHCIDTTGFLIKVLPFNFFTPNAFRPNSEIPENRLFMPVSIGVDPARFRLLIYNRWGHPVFESVNPENKWDGRLKDGHEAPMGNYVWISEFYDIQGFRHEQKGQVVLIR